MTEGTAWFGHALHLRYVWIMITERSTANSAGHQEPLDDTAVAIHGKTRVRCVRNFA